MDGGWVGGISQKKLIYTETWRILKIIEDVGNFMYDSRSLENLQNWCTPKYRVYKMRPSAGSKVPHMVVILRDHVPNSYWFNMSKHPMEWVKCLRVFMSCLWSNHMFCKNGWILYIIMSEWHEIRCLDGLLKITYPMSLRWWDSDEDWRLWPINDWWKLIPSSLFLSIYDHWVLMKWKWWNTSQNWIKGLDIWTSSI